MDTWNVKCSFCGEELSYGVRRCPYCGSLLGKNVNKPYSGETSGTENMPGGDSQPFSQPIPAAADNGQDVYNREEAVREAHDKDEGYYNNEYSDQNKKIDLNKKDEGQSTDGQAASVNTQFISYSVPGAVNNNPGSTSGMDYPYRFQDNDTGEKPLGNGMKVFLTALSTFPWIGQLIGIIAAIVFMNSEYDADRKSFGVALMVSSLTFFVVDSCLGLLIAMAIS